MFVKHRNPAMECLVNGTVIELLSIHVLQLIDLLITVGKWQFSGRRARLND